MLREQDEISDRTEVAVGRHREELSYDVRFWQKAGCSSPEDEVIDIQKANLTYRKQRKHTKGQTKKLTRRLIDLLGKIPREIRKIERSNEKAENLLTVREKNELDIVTKMFHQQKNHFESQDCREIIPDKIVNINKPYVRPIVN